jgi:hypothetical protein
MAFNEGKGEAGQDNTDIYYCRRELFIFNDVEGHHE